MSETRALPTRSIESSNDVVRSKGCRHDHPAKLTMSSTKLQMSEDTIVLPWFGTYVTWCGWRRGSLAVLCKLFAKYTFQWSGRSCEEKCWQEKRSTASGKNLALTNRGWTPIRFQVLWCQETRERSTLFLAHLAELLRRCSHWSRCWSKLELLEEWPRFLLVRPALDWGR